MILIFSLAIFALARNQWTYSSRMKYIDYVAEYGRYKCDPKKAGKEYTPYDSKDLWGSIPTYENCMFRVWNWSTIGIFKSHKYYDEIVEYHNSL